MARGPRRGRAPQEGLLGGAGGGGGARRAGVGDGERRQHRGGHGQRPPAHGPDQGRGPAGHRHRAPGPRRHPTVLLDGGANADCTAGLAGAVRPDGGRVRRRAVRASTEPRVGLLSIGEETSKGNGPGQGDPRPAGRARVPAHRPRSSATSRAATSCPTGSTWWSPTASPATSSSRPSRAAPAFLIDTLLRAMTSTDEGRQATRCCCPLLHAPQRRARPRDLRRGHAPGRRRRVHHQPRLVVAAGPSSTPSAWPGRWSWPTWSGASGTPSRAA